MQLLGATLNREEIANFTFELNCVDNPNRVGRRLNFVFLEFVSDICENRLKKSLGEFIEQKSSEETISKEFW